MMCRLLASVADAAHDRLLGKLLDQYEQKDQLAQQLEGITKLQVKTSTQLVPMLYTCFTIHYNLGGNADTGVCEACNMLYDTAMAQ
jgi:hypothetical protein